MQPLVVRVRIFSDKHRFREFMVRVSDIIRFHHWIIETFHRSWSLESSVCLNMSYSLPKDFRLACREGEFTGQSAGQAPGYAQANLCILPKEYAFDFLLFCQRNPKPCPLLHVIEAGSYTLGDIDIRRDLPKYRIYVDGVLTEETTDVSKHWRDDFVTFVIGCSFSFEDAMTKSGLKVRHIEQNTTVPM